MGKSTNFNSKAQESAYYQEYAYLKIRSSLLFILAIGSLIMTFKIGTYMGELIFPSFPILQYLIANGFVFFAFMGIDWGLANSLSSASNAGKVKNSVWLYAVAALLITLTLSVVSNFVISEEMAGETDRNEYAIAREKAALRDFLNKSSAYIAIENAGKEQSSNIKLANKKGSSLILSAIKSGSKSWQNDYYKHKNIPNGWFWKCKIGPSCPREYIAYRNRIIDAKTSADLLLADASNYKSKVSDIYASTLSYSVKDDSTLNIIQSNLLADEKNQKSKKTDINLVLISLTLGCAILAFILTFVIKDIREGEYGQQIVEDHVKPIMVVMQISKRLTGEVLNVFYSVALKMQTFMNWLGLSKRFELSFETDNTYSNGSVATKTDKKPDEKKSKRLSGKSKSDKRLEEKSERELRMAPFGKRLTTPIEKACLECNTDISHKRSDAKFCGKSCRMKYHNYKPPGL